MKLLVFLSLVGAVLSFQVDPLKHEWLIETSSHELCNITLSCKFNTPVFCQWKRKDRIIETGSRYNYVQESNRDCSLEIRFLTSLDMTYWICEGYSTADNTKNPKFKTLYNIAKDTHKSPFELQKYIKDPNDSEFCRQTRAAIYGPQLILIGNVTTLSNNYYSKFNTYVDHCAWKSGNDSALADGELEYVKNNGHDTDDCSMKTGSRFLKIKKLSRCEAKKELPTMNPKIGSTVWLSCHPTRPVKCVWKLNNEEITISGRLKYDFKDGNNVQDCSIKITNYANSDSGLWLCSKGIDDEEGHNVLNAYQLL